MFILFVIFFGVWPRLLFVFTIEKTIFLFEMKRKSLVYSIKATVILVKESISVVCTFSIVLSIVVRYLTVLLTKLPPLRKL